MYKIIAVESNVFFEKAKKNIRERILEECNHGWKLQGGAQVKIQKSCYNRECRNCHSCSHECFNIYQTLIEGEQHLIDYDIICSRSSVELDEVTKDMRPELEKRLKKGWKLAGGGIIDLGETYRTDGGFFYSVYQTVIKEEP